MSRIFPALLLSLALLSPAMPLQAAEGLPATPQAAVDALSLERDIHTLMRNKKALAGVALLTEDGCNNMVGNDYWTFANGVKCDQATLTSYDDLQRVLEQKFNIQFVPNEEYRQRNPF